jgi:hypothetical protein
MSKDFSTLLPDPKEGANEKISPERVLMKLSDTVNARYNGHILATVTSSGNVIEGEYEILSFTFYLQFNRHNNFIYPLIVVDCIETSGTYPINVVSHYGPPTEYGRIETEEQFEDAIEKILKETRTRNIILSMY